MKKILAALLALSISAILLVSCTNSSDDTASTTQSTETESVVTTDESLSDTQELTESELPEDDEDAEEVEDDEEIFVDVEYLINEYSLDELIENSDCAFTARYIECIPNEYYVEFAFEVVDNVYGEVTDDVIYVYRNGGVGDVYEIDYSYDMTEEIYEVGKEYILITERYSSIMYEHDRYMIAADILLCPEDNVYVLYSEDIEIPDGMTAVEYISSFYDDRRAEDAANYVPAEEVVYENAIDEMCGEAKFVGIVRTESLLSESNVGKNATYFCTVTTLYKGDFDDLDTYADGTILLSVFKDKVEVGGEYIVAFTPADEGSLIYVQETVESVYDVSDDVISQIETSLAIK